MGIVTPDSEKEGTSLWPNEEIGSASRHGRTGFAPRQESCFWAGTSDDNRGTADFGWRKILGYECTLLRSTNVNHLPVMLNVIERQPSSLCQKKRYGILWGRSSPKIIGITW